MEKAATSWHRTAHPSGAIIATGILATAWACSPGARFAPQDSTIEIHVTTRYWSAGTEVSQPASAEGYTAFVKDVSDAGSNEVKAHIQPNGMVLFDNLGVGFQLKYGIRDIPPNCGGLDENGVLHHEDESYGTWWNSVLDKDKVTLFRLSCVLPSAGSLDVTITGLPSGAAPIVTVSGASIPTTNVGGTGQTFPDLAPGDYQIDALSVEFEGVTYLPSPPSQTVTVVTGQTAGATVRYAPTPATLTVDVTGLPTGVVASVAVSGPDGFSRALQGPTTLDGLAPGTYTVDANTVTAGTTNWQPTPLSQTVDLVSGATAAATVDYAAVLGVGSLEVVVTGMPPAGNADVTVIDPSGGVVHLTASQTLTDLAPGVYAVIADTLTADYHMEPEVDTLHVEVKVGETASVEVSYLTVSKNLLVDPSWEVGLVTVATPVIPEAPGEWHGDLVGVTGEENGIKPADGLWMLHFIASGPFGAGAGSTGSEMYQLLAIPSELVGAIAGGTASVAAQALFNRVAGDPATTDSRFTVDIFAFDGAPADARAKVGAQGWLARQVEDLDTDADPLTWEPLQSVVVTVPPTTTVLLLRLLAVENVKDDATLPEFDGHYMDDASLVIRWKRTF